MTSKPVVHLLDYGAGNVLSVINALHFLGYAVRVVDTPDGLQDARVRELHYNSDLIVPYDRS